MLIRFLDEPSANREQAGGFSRFGASPHQHLRVRERVWPTAKRRTLPQPFDLLQHTFGDLADLARGQEREMKQLEQQ
jgi:hypothetical protein